MKQIQKFLSVILCVALLCTLCVAAGAKQPPVTLDAKGAVLMDISTGKVLYAENENAELFPASVTKVMSLILVMEALESGKISLKDTVSASKNAVSYGGSQIWLKEGEQMAVDELLKAVVIASANDACTALAEYVAGSSEAFVEKMNEKAGQLGMEHTHFENCTGLDETEKNHYSSAYDIALMSRELMRYEQVQKYSTVWMDSLRGGETMLVNTNRLVRSYSGCIGLKTGTTTKAGFCVSAVARREQTTLCAVILGSKTSEARFEAASRLLDFGFAGFETAYPVINLSQSAQVKVVGGMEQSAVPIAAVEQPAFTVEKGNKNEVETKITLESSVRAPVEKGKVLGKAEFFLGGKKIGTVDIVNKEYIGRVTFWQAVKNLLKSI